MTFSVLGWTLLHFLWQGTAIALLYAVARRLIGHRVSPDTRYRLACFTLLSLVAAPIATFFILPNSAGSSLSNWRPPGVVGNRALEVVVIAWAGGVLFFSLRVLGGWRVTRRLRATSSPVPVEWQERLTQIAARMGASSGVRLHLSPFVNVPTVIGTLRPLILLPINALTGWPMEQTIALLAHEIAHVLRHDFLVNLLQSVAEAVLFYHPAVWWISAQIRVEREQCCDDLAVRATDVMSYSQALLSLEAFRASVPQPALAANGGPLAHRIRRLLDPESVRERNLPGPAAAWAMACLWIAGMGVATLHASPPVTSATRPAEVPPPVVAAGVKKDPWTAPDLSKIAGHLRNTLLYDPVLTAQAQTPSNQPNVPVATKDQWKKWLNEDVAYIITDEERKAFRELQSDEEWEKSVEQFWLRRDPTPDTVNNEYKEEHYRRIAYANEHFTTRVPGWKTDRGKTYIVLGPPDEIDSHPTGSADQAPFEDWRYRFFSGARGPVKIEFVDSERNGEYHMTTDPGLQTQPPGAPAPDPNVAVNAALQRLVVLELTSLQRLALLERLQPAREPNGGNILPMKVKVDYLRLTSNTVAANVTVQIDGRDLDGGADGESVTISGRVNALGERRVTEFWKPMRVAGAGNGVTFQQSIPLPAGSYRLDLLGEESARGKVNHYQMALNVPAFDPAKLDASSLILADSIEKAPAQGPSGPMFMIGDFRVRPRVGSSFHRDETLGIYMQVYGLEITDSKLTPDGVVNYEIEYEGNKDVSFSEEIAARGATGEQWTIVRKLPLSTLAPGTYSLTISVKDRNRNQVVTKAASFTVLPE